MTVSVIIQPYHANQNDFLRQLPKDYGEKRDYPKIDLYLNGHYMGSTTWARTLQTAMHAWLTKNLATNGSQLIAEFAK